jgi:hypothetical protein
MTGNGLLTLAEVEKEETREQKAEGEKRKTKVEGEGGGRALKNSKNKKGPFSAGPSTLLVLNY